MNHMDRRRFLQRSAYGLAGLALVGCTRTDNGAGTNGGASARPTLRVPGSALGFPSPFAYIAGVGYRQMSLVYDTLLWPDSSGRLLPWLARRFEGTDDGQAFTFELRDDVRWHDGRPLTAHDVVFTFRYHATNALSPLLVARPQGVTTVDALDDRRVRVQLVRPDRTFLGWTAAALPIVPRHVWADVDDPAAEQDLSILIGSGPYQLASYGGDQGPLLYSSNDDHFLGRPFVERLEMTPVGDELTALRAGEVDAATTDVNGARPDALAPFRDDARFGMVDRPGGFTFPLFWNLRREGPLSDVRFRRACAMAIDRDDVVQRLTGGNGVPGNTGFLPPTNPFHVDVEQYPHDPDGARAMLGAAGYRRVRLELLFPTTITPLAEVVIDALARVGVELVPQGVELGPDLFARKLAGDYDMAITLYPGPSGAEPDTDPDVLRQLFSSRAPTGLNHADGYTDGELDRLGEEQLEISNGQELRRIVGRMQQIVARDLPVLALYYPTLFHVFDRSVFDQWYWTPDGFPPVGPYNRQLFATGSKTGLEIRSTD
jgi:peptide/nickel transport system substrate-binding protein